MFTSISELSSSSIEQCQKSSLWRRCQTCWQEIASVSKTLVDGSLWGVRLCYATFYIGVDHKFGIGTWKTGVYTKAAGPKPSIDGLGQASLGVRRSRSWNFGKRGFSTNCAEVTRTAMMQLLQPSIASMKEVRNSETQKVCEHVMMAIDGICQLKIEFPSTDGPDVWNFNGKDFCEVLIRRRKTETATFDA